MKFHWYRAQFSLKIHLFGLEWMEFPCVKIYRLSLIQEDCWTTKLHTPKKLQTQCFTKKHLMMDHVNEDPVSFSHSVLSLTRGTGDDLINPEYHLSSLCCRKQYRLLHFKRLWNAKLLHISYLKQTRPTRSKTQVKTLVLHKCSRKISLELEENSLSTYSPWNNINSGRWSFFVVLST